VNRTLYTLLLRLVLPLVLWRMRRDARRDPALAIDWRQRLGRSYPPGAPRTPGPLWIHAVSVGEVQSTAGLVAALRDRFPTRPLLLTMATATGRAQAARLHAPLLATPAAGVPPVLELAYVPFDLPGAVARFLDRYRPAAVILLETELWPNLIAAAADRGLPVALVSARISGRSVDGYRRWAAGFARQTMGRLALVAAQSAGDARRFVELGAPAERVAIAGSLKFDFPLPADLDHRAAGLRRRFLGTRRAWVAGSTHPGEEAQCIDAQRRLAADATLRDADGTTPLLVLVPRHPDRFDAVASELAGQGLRVLRRSSFAIGAPAAQEVAAADVLLVDTIGELLAFYAAADVAFVGGSLVPVGGHNLLEPASVGRPVVTGPHSFNAPDAAALLESRGALLRVADAGSLAATLAGLFADPARAARVALAGREAVEENRGAAARTIARLLPLLPSG
jgi:3-deoxy-D-manno-octulosonic-acid transferase